MTDERQDQLDAPRDPQTAAGLALARQSLSKPVTIDQILAIEDEAQEFAARERDELRAAAEAVVGSMHGLATGVVGGPDPLSEDFRWYVSGHAVAALRAALDSKDGASPPQCDYSETGPQIEGAPFGPSTRHCVLRLGHAGPHEFKDVAL